MGLCLISLHLDCLQCPVIHIAEMFNCESKSQVYGQYTLMIESLCLSTTINICSMPQWEVSMLQKFAN
jgi:hypothetical protein